MPVCSYFLKGVCSHSSCPYSHVYVSRKAEVCSDFLKGYCPLGAKVSSWGWAGSSAAPRRQADAATAHARRLTERQCCPGRVNRRRSQNTQ